MTGAIRPGARINTDALARQFKVSHIPIREALKRLETVGLITREPNKSAHVLELSREDIEHIFQVRTALEGLAISLAAPRLDALNRRRLQSLVQTMRENTKSKDFAKLFAADKEFHETIWALSGNPFLVKSLSTLLLPYFGFLATRGYYLHSGDLDYVPRVHQEILDSMIGRDGARARQVMTDVHNRFKRLLFAE